MTGRRPLAVFLSLSLGLSSALSAAPAAAASFPAYVNYQGKLGDASGNPLTGTYSFRFKFYSAPVGGTASGCPRNTSSSSAGAWTPASS